MTLLEAIDCRISRRSFLTSPIASSKLEAIQVLINQYNREQRLNIELVVNGENAFNGLRKSYGMFSGIKILIVLKGDADVACVEEKLGFFGEYLVLEATRQGLGSCWVGGTFDRNSKAFNLSDDEILSCVIPIGNVPEEERFKERFIRKIARGKEKPLGHFYTADTTPPQWFMDGIKSVQKAPSAVNRQKYKFEYLQGVVRAHSEDTSQYAMVDLGIAKAHFVIAAGGQFEFGDNGMYTR